MATKQEMKREFHEYLASKCEGATEYLNNRQLREDYKPRENIPSDLNIALWMAEFKKNVFNIRNKKERIRMLFVLGVQITKPVFSMLKQDAHVEWNSNKVITKYVSNDGNLRFERKERGRPSGRPSRCNAIIDQDESPQPVPSKRPRRNSDARRPLSPEEQEVNQEEDESLREEPIPNERPSRIDIATPMREVNQEDFDFAHIKVENPEIPEEVKPDIGFLEQQLPMNRMPAKPALPLAAHNSFLKAMHTMIYAQKLPIDQNVVLRLREASEGIERMQLIGAPNPNEIPIDDFVTTIHHTVLVARRNTFNFCVEESRSLRDFLLLLHFSIANLMMVELEELEAKLMESIEDPENLNKRIPIGKFNKVLESILELLVPN
ncbi:unnamed protein product [Caenorhabditis brenneri]